MIRIKNILILTIFIFFLSFYELHDYNVKLITKMIVQNDNLINRYSNEENELINLLDPNLNQSITIINRNISLPNNYIPEDLITPKVNLVGHETEPRSKIRGIMESDLTNMFNDANSTGLDLFLLCGYRSYDEQAYLYNEELKITHSSYTDLVAPPGHSEHQLGLAIDVTIPELNFYLDESFEKSNAFLWLKNNSHKYGFIMRYPKGKESITGYSYEPWHFRYVGNNKISTYCFDNNITLEEIFIKFNIK